MSNTFLLTLIDHPQSHTVVIVQSNIPLYVVLMYAIEIITVYVHSEADGETKYKPKAIRLPFEVRAIDVEPQ